MRRPRFHAMYAEYDALIDIRTLEIIAGGLPRRPLSMTIEWAIEHRDELMEEWNLRAVFGQARLDLGVVVWPNGADLDPAWMYEKIRDEKT